MNNNNITINEINNKEKYYKTIDLIKLRNHIINEERFIISENKRMDPNKIIMRKDLEMFRDIYLKNNKKISTVHFNPIPQMMNNNNNQSINNINQYIHDNNKQNKTNKIQINNIKIISNNIRSLGTKEMGKKKKLILNKIF